MAKIIFEFDANDESVEAQLAKDGGKWHAVCWDIDQWLRACLKYGHEFKTVEDALSGARNELLALLDARSLTWD